MRLTQLSAWTGLLLGGFVVSALLSPEPLPNAGASLERDPLSVETQRKIERRASVITSSRLIVPVSGVAASALNDTWGSTRAEGRTHEGIDIMAPMGAPVLAAADGRIVKFFDSVRGGVTIYQLDTSERFIYYYAHLSNRAPGLAEGDVVHQGQVIAFVGMTGNAPVPHLHFEIQRLTPERHWWQADPMNPHPLLVAGRAPD